ncbi:right-handed parallel beta-helix repeat-containing protein [bacterium]|nr:right-handed parallel beta-helix repeat-containing protein [bacterium]
MALCLPARLDATIYYVDATGGSDSNPGTSEALPWRTLDKVNRRTFQPGDAILLARGRVWREQLTVPSSGGPDAPIVFSAYGVGERPKILGSNVVSGFQVYSASALRAPWPYSTSVVYFDDQRGRKQTSLAALAQPGDWYWQSGELFVYPGSFTTVEAARREYVIKCINRHYVVFDELWLGRGSYITFDLFTGQNIVVRNCDIHGSASGSPNFRVGAAVNGLLVEHCTFGRPEDESFSGRRLLEMGAAGSPGLGGNWIVRNCTFHWTTENDTGLIGNDWALGVMGVRQGNVLIDECAFHNIEDDGVYISGNDTAGAIMVQNCYVVNAGNAGIRTWNQQGTLGGPVIIHKNKVQGCGFAHNDAMGIHINSTWSPTLVEYNEVWGGRNLDPNAEDGGGIAIDGDSRGAVVRYNLVHDNFGKGIYVYGISGPSFNHVVHHNVVYNNDCGITVSGNWNAPVSNVLVHNNTCYKNYNGPTMGPNYDTEILVGPYASAVDLRNNILYSSSSTPTYYLIENSLGAITADYNLVFREGGGAIARSSTSGFRTYAQWRALGYDASGINADPLFVNPGLFDFRLTSGSPARDAGDTVPFLLDFLGVLIPQGPKFDMGAYEYGNGSEPTPTPTVDPTITPSPTHTATPTPTVDPTITPTLPPAGWSDVWHVVEQTSATISRNSLTNRNFRNWIKGAYVHASAPAVRLRLRGATAGTGTFVDNVTIGRRAVSGDPYDFAAPPTVVTFNDAPYVLVPPNTTVYSDPVAFPVEAGADYIVAMYLEGSELIPLWNQSGTIHGYSRNVAENQTGMVNVSGYNEVYSIYIVEALEGTSQPVATPTPTPLPDTGQPPTWAGPRAVLLPANSGFHESAIELSQYAWDDATPRNLLQFGLVSQDNFVAIGVEVQVTGRVRASVQPEARGTNHVVFAIQDVAGNATEVGIDFVIMGATSVPAGVWNLLR